MQSQHYRIADHLLVVGAEVVTKISALNDKRQALIAEIQDHPDSTEHDDAIVGLTVAMDEHGKMAMGIWAQATVHALLAQTSPTVVSIARQNS